MKNIIYFFPFCFSSSLFVICGFLLCFAFALNYVHGFLSKFGSTGRIEYFKYCYIIKVVFFMVKLTKCYCRNCIDLEVREPGLQCSVILTNVLLIPIQISFRHTTASSPLFLQGVKYSKHCIVWTDPQLLLYSLFYHCPLECNIIEIVIIEGKELVGIEYYRIYILPCFFFFKKVKNALKFNMKF